MAFSPFFPANRTILAALALTALAFASVPCLAQDAAPATAQPAALAPSAAAPATPQATAPAVPSAAPQAPAAAAPSPAPSPAAAPANPAVQAPAAGLAPAAPAASPTAAPTPAPQTPAPQTPAPNETTLAPSDVPASVPSHLLPHDLSPWGMFLAADIIVKVVMIGLAFASVVTWTVWLAKSLELFTARQRAQKQLAVLAHENSLASAQAGFATSKGAVAQMLAAASGELQRSAALSPEGIKERAAALIARIEARAGREMNRGTGLLATIGATAPFVGLFGTVWGIMNSFIGISKTNTTNLAVVAPGIAEALLATAFGLVAAIPAVMIYNVFARSIASYRATLGDAAAEILRHVSRDLDRSEMDTEAEADWRTVRPIRQSAE